jgi:hypothetical protein
MFKQCKTHYANKEFKDQVHEVASRHEMYKIDYVVGNSVTITTINPRMLAPFKDKRDS